jgi:Uma2 family endonuclease
LVDKGAFRDQRLYLFRGELIEMPPMGAMHARCLIKVTDWLYSNFKPKYVIRGQMSFDTPGESMPEPDAAVVTNEALQRLPHPNTAIFVIEVSDSSIEWDRDKALEYAAAGVADYWIVDVNARQIEVYRQIVPDQSIPLGFRYSVREVVSETDVLAPLAKPEARITVADLLP